MLQKRYILLAIFLFCLIFLKGTFASPPTNYLYQTNFSVTNGVANYKGAMLIFNASNVTGYKCGTELFQDASGNNISFIRNGCNATATSNVTYFLKLPSSGSYNVTLYTGNTTAVTDKYDCSINSAIFCYDFEGGSTTGWTTWNGGTFAVQNNNLLTGSNYGWYAYNPSTWDGGYITSNLSTTTAETTRLVYNLYGYNTSAISHYFYIGDTSNNKIFSLRVNTDGSLENPVGGWQDIKGIFFNANAYQTIIVELNTGAGYFNLTFINSTGVYRNQSSLATQTTTPSYQQVISVTSDVGGVNVSGDALYIFNYTLPEPTFSQYPTTTYTSPASTNISLWLNNNQNNLTIAYGTSLNATARINVTGLWVAIEKNGTLIANGTTTSQNVTTWEAGYFQIRAYYPGNGTYLSSERTYYVNITPGPASLNLSINGTQGNVSGTYPYPTNATAWSNTTGTVTLYRNGSSVSNSEIIQLGAGIYNYTATYNHSNYTAPSVTYYLNISPASSGLSMTASPGWTIGEGTQSNITCSGSPSVILYKNGINVTNPYSAILTYGTYTFQCNLTDQANYTPYTTSNSLVVQPSGFGCSDNVTYAFGKTISVTGSLINLNFTNLTTNNLVKSDLSDVYVNTSNISVIGKNNSLLIVNVTNVSSIYVKYGNYIVNNSYSNTSTLSANSTSMDNYNEITGYYVFNLLDEVDGTSALPPNATSSMYLYCSGGETNFYIANNTPKFLVATWDILTDVKAVVSYSATDIYYRNLLVSTVIEYKTMYLVDANQNQMVQFVMSLQDNVGTYGSSTLKVKKYLGNALATITELNFDAEKKAIVYLINGDQYQIYVDNNQGEERSIGYFMVDPTDLTKTIVINPINYTNLTYGNLSVNLVLNSGVITFTWYDQGGQTSWVEFWVYNYTNSSQLLYYTSSSNQTSVQFSYAVPDANASYIAKYLIHHNIFGLNTTGAQKVLAGSYLYPSTFPLVYLFTSLNIPASTSVFFLFLIFVIPMVMLFSEKHKGLAGIIIVVIIGLLDYWKVFTIPEIVPGMKYALLGLGLFLSVLLELKTRRSVVVG